MRQLGEHVGSFWLAEKAGAAGFTADDEELLVLFAAQAAVAVANARAFRDERRARRRPRGAGRHLPGRRGGVRRGDGAPGLAQPRDLGASSSALRQPRPHRRGPPRRDHLPARRRQRAGAGHVPARHGASAAPRGVAGRGDRVITTVDPAVVCARGVALSRVATLGPSGTETGPAIRALPPAGERSRSPSWCVYPRSPSGIVPPSPESVRRKVIGESSCAAMVFRRVPRSFAVFRDGIGGRVGRRSIREETARTRVTLPE